VKAIYWIIGFLLSMTVASVTQAQAQTSAAGAVDSSASSAEIAQIARIRERWMQYWNAGELPAILQGYAADAVLLPPSGQRVTGREAIGKYFQQIRGSGVGTLSLQSVACFVAGPLAYDSGRLKYTAAGAALNQPNQVSPSASAGPSGHPVEGNYLVVLRRQPDGRWLIVQHAFTEAVMKGLLEDKRPLVKPYPVQR